MPRRYLLPCVGNFARQAKAQSCHAPPRAFLGKVQPELPIHIADRNRTRYRKRAICLSLDRLGDILIALAEDLPHQLLEQVLQRDNSRRSSLLIDNDGNLDSPCSHLL